MGGNRQKDAKYPLAAIRRAREDGDAGFLLASLTSTNASVREAAARSLGVLEATMAVRPLTRLLSSRDPGMRVVVTKALGRIGDSHAADSLLEIAADDPEPGVRVSAMSALARLRDRRAIPLIAEFLVDPNLDTKFSESAMRPSGNASIARRSARRMLREFNAVEALPRLEEAAHEAHGMNRWRLGRLIRVLSRSSVPASS
jgi:HEAT repeat protein